MLLSKKIIITGAILTVIAGTSVFADEIGQVTGLQDVQATQNVQATEQEKVTTTDGTVEGEVGGKVETTPISNTDVQANLDGTATVAVGEKATGLNNALTHVKNENARQHIQANIEKQNAKAESKQEQKSNKNEDKKDK